MPRDLALERGLPANIDAERFVLGSILLDDANYVTVSATLQADDFSIEKHRRIFLRMGELYSRNERIDRVTVANELVRQGQLESVDGVTYLVSLDEGLPTLANLDSYVTIVKEKSIARKIIFVHQRSIDSIIAGGASTSDVIQSSENFLRGVRAELPGKRKSRGFSEILDARGGMDSYTRPREGVIRSRFPRLNNYLSFGGFLPGQMIVIAARPGMGKTAFGLQQAHCTAMNGSGVIFFSMEMLAEDLLDRIAIAKSGLSIADLENLGDEGKRRRLLAALTGVSEMPLWIDDASRTLADCHASIRDRLKTDQVKLAVFDYLQKMHPSSTSGTRNDQVSDISGGIKDFGMEYRIPTIALAQLTRLQAREKRAPELTDLRDSGSIEQDSDKVIFIWREGGEDPEEDANLDPVEASFLIAKQRNGQLRNVRLQFQKKRTMFTDSRAEEDY